MRNDLVKALNRCPDILPSTKITTLHVDGYPLREIPVVENTPSLSVSPLASQSLSELILSG
jgi:hypothetical protein